MTSTDTAVCDMNTKFGILRASIANGRLGEVTYRRNEIAKLYNRLRDESESVCNAMASDGRCSAIASETEFRLLMNGIKRFHTSLKVLLTRQRSLGPRQDDLYRRVAVGIVAIKPTVHSRVYSIVIAVTGAIAAGNCVLLELSRENSSIDAVLSEILKSVLDQKTIQISHEKLEDNLLAQVDLIVDQDNIGSVKSVSRLHGLRKARAIAFVDETSDIQKASHTITESRLSPHNTSPYSPSLVHVHEGVLHEFRRACLEHADDFPSPYANKSTCTLAGHDLDLLLKEAEGQGVVQTFINARSGLSLVEVKPKLHRSSPILSSQIKGPYIIVLPFTIPSDIAISTRSSDPLLASYIFGEVGACRLLAADVRARVTYCNQIPLSLLYGPAAPHSHVPTLHPRYTTDMFSTPSPIIFNPAPDIPNETVDLVKKVKTVKTAPTDSREPFVPGISMLLMVPAVVFCGFLTIRKYGWVSLTVASMVRDMKGFGG